MGGKKIGVTRESVQLATCGISAFLVQNGWQNKMEVFSALPYSLVTVTVTLVSSCPSSAPLPAACAAMHAGLSVRIRHALGWHLRTKNLASASNLTLTATMNLSQNSLCSALDSATCSALQPHAIDSASQWRDENGRVCPKSVNYARHCPKGHDLIPVNGSDVTLWRKPGAAVLCRICHGSYAHTHASHSLECSVAHCCGGYFVCRMCVTAIVGIGELSVSRSLDDAAAMDSFCMLVKLCVSFVGTVSQRTPQCCIP